MSVAWSFKRRRKIFPKPRLLCIIAWLIFNGDISGQRLAQRTPVCPSSTTLKLPELSSSVCQLALSIYVRSSQVQYFSSQIQVMTTCRNWWKTSFIHPKTPVHMEH